MGRFVIHTHQRLQEWVAQEKGYYAQEGLDDYVLAPNDLGIDENDDRRTERGFEYGAYESYEKGRRAAVSCACHWTVNMAASAEHGMLWGECYSVTPAAIFVPPESRITKAEQLAGVPVQVGYHSGSHYSAIQALEAVLPPERINVVFGGPPDERLAAMLERRAEAACVFGVQYYVLEQLGFRKLLDGTFMIAAMIAKDAAIDDVRRYFRALRRAQVEIDLEHQRYVHYYLRELPERFHPLIDVRTFGPGERLVFEPYTKEMYDRTHAWVEARGLFDLDKIGKGTFEEAVLSGVPT
jgi:ABC-type nitrate/sulfonate/bicarbonate transport system substrate-binding protein